MSALGFVAIGSAMAVLGALQAAFSPCGQSMLASLTPLGERSRGFSWTVTAGAYAIGALAAGTLAGAGLGAAGSLLPTGTGWRSAVVVAVVALAVVIDSTPLRRRLPLTRRQVNEDWMSRYRGWVYGFGFGAQLGLGVTTLVACAAIYASAACELLCGSAGTGAVIGAVFGATKALSLLPAGTARDPGSLIALHRRLTRAEPVLSGALRGLELAAFAVLLGTLT